MIGSSRSARRRKVSITRIWITRIESKGITVLKKGLELTDGNGKAQAFGTGADHFHIVHSNHLPPIIEQGPSRIARANLGSGLNVQAVLNDTVAQTDDTLGYASFQAEDFRLQRHAHPAEVQSKNQAQRLGKPCSYGPRS